MNGTDVSRASQEEAVEVFNSAAEPITVEVVKRGVTTDTDDLPEHVCRPQSEMVTVSVQTEKLEDAHRHPTFWEEEIDSYVENVEDVESLDEGSPFEYEVRLT